jgi:hypothetical protein
LTERAFVRRGGARGDGPTSSIWSVAEGARGRRWRTVETTAGRVGRAILLELDPEGRPTRLEVATAAGLLTLHPEPDERSIHGNVVRAGGIDHLALAWSDRHEIVVGEVGGWAIAARVGRRLAVGATVEVPVLEVGLDLGLVERTGVVQRLDAAAWAIDAGREGGGSIVRLDADGAPLDAGETWPLELVAGGG